MKINTFIKLTNDEKNIFIKSYLNIWNIECAIFKDNRDLTKNDLEAVKKHMDEMDQLKKEKLLEKKQNPIEKAPMGKFIDILNMLSNDEKELFKKTYFALSKQNQDLFYTFIDSLYDFIFSNKDINKLLYDLFFKIQTNKKNKDHFHVNEDLYLFYLEQYFEPFYKPIFYRKNSEIRQQFFKVIEGKPYIVITDGNDNIIEKGELPNGYIEQMVDNILDNIEKANNLDKDDNNKDKDDGDLDNPRKK